MSERFDNLKRSWAPGWWFKRFRTKNYVCSHIAETTSGLSSYYSFNLQGYIFLYTFIFSGKVVVFEREVLRDIENTWWKLRIREVSPYLVEIGFRWVFIESSFRVLTIIVLVFVQVEL